MHNYRRLYTIKSNGGIFSKFKNKALKPSTMKTGYNYVTMYDGEGNHKKFLVHRLIATEHLPNPKNLPEINHKDLNKTNNDVNNLEWCTHGDNMRHARKHGTNIYTLERNRKISEAKKGIPRSNETNQKVAQYWLGQYKQGYVNPMTGKHLSAKSIKQRTHSRYHNLPVKDCDFC